MTRFASLRGLGAVMVAVVGFSQVLSGRTAPAAPEYVASAIAPSLDITRQDVIASNAKVSQAHAALIAMWGADFNRIGRRFAAPDLVKYYGGEPANFLDIGGSSNPEKVVAALRIITADPSVKAILFNIFGGITRTDDVANGIVTAIKANPLKVPLVIRLTGTNEEIAVKILQENGLSAMTDMDEAVKKAVSLATGKVAA